MSSPTPPDRIRALLQDAALPCAVVDLAAFDANLRTMRAAAGARATLRVASKSVRSVPLLVRALREGAPRVRGLMTYAAAETAFLARHGLDDLLLAYPALGADELATLAALAAEGRTVKATVDHPSHVAALGAAATARGAVVPAVVDVDMSYRILGLHLGVRRSPLRTPAEVVDLARVVARTPGVSFAGVLAYEAQIAGLPDQVAGSPLESAIRRRLKRASRAEVAARRAAIVAALRDAGLPASLVNGGGTGSLSSTSAEEVVTEVTAGSGLFDPHLFDGYDGLGLQPAACFALRVTRLPGGRHVTCQGGGYVASGAAGRDRLPRPVFPPGLSLLPVEGAGEVQTPLAVAAGCAPPAPGEIVLFRHAKAGELCERFSELVLVEEGRIVGRAATYRGEGASFG